MITRIIFIIFFSFFLTSLHAIVPSNELSRSSHPQKITIIGTGYVGLVTGTCLAVSGNYVICADIDSAKIAQLKKGMLTFYEPHLESLVTQCLANGRLSFTDNIASAIQSSDILFVSVNTPCLPDGHADLRAVNAVIDSIAENRNAFKVICIKSTVPIGTAHDIHYTLQSKGMECKDYALVSNPEFLREGSAIHDFFYPDRIVVGTQSPTARNIMNTLYEPFINRGIPILYTDHTSAETIKYAANAFLASKISFINEIANLCDNVGADILAVAQGMGYDKRIGFAFLNPGPGFGGSCFPKDCQALLTTAQDYNTRLEVVSGALNANNIQKNKPIEKLKALINQPLQGLTICILGLAFKANTDDVRYSPAITTIELLQKEGAIIKVYDPAAMGTMAQLFSTINYCSSAYEALEGADAVIILTEWDEFKQLELSEVKKCMRQHYFIDARNLFDCHELTQTGFVWDNIGHKVYSV